VAPAGRAPAVALALLVGGVAAWSSLRGADRARAPFDARALAEAALERAHASGSEAAPVRDAVLRLRRVLGRRPLDSASRVVYASALLGLGRSVDDLPAAVFHAERAVALAPVTLPVVRRATLVLAHTGEIGRALELVRSAFEFEPWAAADLLARIEPLLGDRNPGDGVAETPEAWLAWSIRLERDQRNAQAHAWLERAWRRWPDHAAILEHTALVALRHDDRATLEELFARELALPDGPTAATLLLHRARFLAPRDPARARADVERALRIDGDRPGTLASAGQVALAIGDFDRARRLWVRALLALEGGDATARRDLLLRLARLEDDHGRAGDALRHWRALLEIDPEDTEARRRVRELTGLGR
jgi:tetratricopeptide (TPR) repeat protein